MDQDRDYSYGSDFARPSTLSTSSFPNDESATLTTIICQPSDMSAAFDGGLISSDGGLPVARGDLGLANTLAGCIRDRRNQALVLFRVGDRLRLRGCRRLRRAAHEWPQRPRPLAPPSHRASMARMTAALVDFCRSGRHHRHRAMRCGNQQLSLFNAHYDTRCFLPVHVYHVESGKPVAVLLRPGKTPSGPDRTLHLVRRIRRHWPHTRLVFRGDNYGRPQAMAWSRTMASTTSSASQAIARCIPSHTTWPTISRCRGTAPSPPSMHTNFTIRTLVSCTRVNSHQNNVGLATPFMAADRCPRRRKGRPHPHPLHLGLPRRRPLPPARRAPRGSRALTAGAPCPANPSPFNP